jgi:hypothetical protein
MNSPKFLKDLHHHNTNTSMVTIGTDNTDINMKDPFLLPPMILTDRSERVMDPTIKSMLPKPPKPPSTTTTQPLFSKQATILSGSSKSKVTIINFGSVRDELSLKDISSQVYLKIKSAPPFSVI